MRITYGNITLEGSTLAEIGDLLAMLPKLAPFVTTEIAQVPRASRTSPIQAPAVPLMRYTAEQIAQAGEAIAKGYGYETSWKAINAMEKMRRTKAEIESGQGSEQIALARLQAMVSSEVGESVQDVPPANPDEVDESDL